MKNKIKIHQFDPVIYPRNVWITVGATLSTIYEHFEISSVDAEYYAKNRGKDVAVGFKVVQKGTMFQGILMIFRDKKSFTFKTVAHESAHIADYIFEEIGAYSQDFSDKNEPYTYLVGWVADCIEQVKINKFK